VLVVQHVVVSWVDSWRLCVHRPSLLSKNL